MTAPSEPSAQPGLGSVGSVINLAGLVLLTYGVASFPHTHHPAAIALLAVAALSWLAWLSAVTCRLPSSVLLPATSVMAVAGGMLTPLAALAMVFPAVAAFSVTLNLPFRRALPVIMAGPAAMFVSTAVLGRSYGAAIGGLSAVFAACVLGISRRESQERIAQAAKIDVAEAEAEAEAARAELLAGRNHLARELHDVLAHTLSALSLQLEGLDALLPPERTPAVTDQLDRIKRLVRDGLDEAKGAVAALRDDLPPLDERLAKLAAERHAGMELTGTPRLLTAEVSLALYRVAQEALTNAAKHAPGAPAELRLDYADKEVTLSITNPASPTGPAPLAGSGGGYGLQGIRERVLLIGGQVEAGPADGGWSVRARVPA